MITGFRIRIIMIIMLIRAYDASYIILYTLCILLLLIYTHIQCVSLTQTYCQEEFFREKEQKALEVTVSQTQCFSLCFYGKLTPQFQVSYDVTPTFKENLFLSEMVFLSQIIFNQVTTYTCISIYLPFDSLYLVYFFF